MRNKKECTYQKTVVFCGFFFFPTMCLQLFSFFFCSVSYFVGSGLGFWGVFLGLFCLDNLKID